MGGRGSASASSKYGGGGGGILVMGGSAGEDMLTAGMTATDEAGGFRYTSTEATLSKLETEALSLDHEQLKIVDSNGFVLAAVDGEKHSVGITDNALKNIKGNTVTHNHPAGYGGTFSEADVASLSLGMKEMRASAAEGTYSIKATNKATADSARSFAAAYQKASQGSLGRRAADAATAKAAKGGTEAECRKAYCDTLGGWLSKNASKYGYKYSFTANGDYNIKNAGGYDR